MNYTINWKNVHFPLWFYPTLKDLMEKWSQKNTQWLEYVSALSRDEYVKEIQFPFSSENGGNWKRSVALPYIYIQMICMKITDGQKI